MRRQSRQGDETPTRAAVRTALDIASVPDSRAALANALQRLCKTPNCSAVQASGSPREASDSILLDGRTPSHDDAGRPARPTPVAVTLRCGKINKRL